METPIQKIQLAGCNNKVYVKREDLIPFSFGGNKVRIAMEFFDDMKAKNKNCMVGYGNARSNLCRVLSNMSASKGNPCYIISPADEDGTRSETANSTMSKMCGARFAYCTKQNVAETVDEVLHNCEQQGLRPYYIYGDRTGQGNKATPVRAYEKVYQEIKKQEAEIGINFDYIFLATGTGMTQAGLIAGKQQMCGKEKIVGISVARKRENAEKVIADYIAAFENETEKVSAGGGGT